MLYWDSLSHMAKPLFKRVYACTFTSIPSMCIRTVHALIRLCECAGSSEPSLFTYAIFTIRTSDSLNEGLPIK